MSEFAGGEEGVSTRGRGGRRPLLSAREWLLLLVLAAVQFTHIVDFVLIMPLGPVYQDQLEVSAQQFGLVVAAYTASAFVAGLCASFFLDRFDRKKALLTLYTGFVAGTFLCAVADSYLLLLAARTVAGAFGGVSAAVVLAIVGDAFPDARRGTAMGVIMSAFSAASIVGVPLGLHLADVLGWQAPFAALAGLSACVLVLAAAVLPPLRGHLGRRREEAAAFVAVLADPNHLKAFALTAVLVLSTFMMWPFLPIYLEHNVGLRQDQLKFVYLCGGLATLVTLTLFGWLSDRFGKLRVFRLLALATLGPIALVTNLPYGLAIPLVLVLTTALMVASTGRMVPATALITATSVPRYRGSFMSLNAAVQHLASAVAAGLGGLFLTQENKNAPLIGFAVLGLVACAWTLVGLVLAGLLRPARGDVAVDSAAVAGAAEAEPADEGEPAPDGEAAGPRPAPEQGRPGWEGVVVRSD